MRFKIKKALFLDLDGTCRRSKSGKKFISSASDIEIIPGMTEKVKSFKEQGYLILGVSNQGGVAFGLKTLEDCSDETEVTDNLMDSVFDTINYCPFHEAGNTPPFNIKSTTRKPGYGMISELEFAYLSNDIIIDLANSLFVGDREEDKLCAEGAGVPFMWADEFLAGETSVNV